jgi:tRNA threonylcarbamoyladenosine biosynthesis protein TsaE
VVIETASPVETYNLGLKIGLKLKPGDIVGVIGELGAGKTVLIQGIARSLGIFDYVTSPTFTIINEYKGLYTFYHMDLYRLDDLSQIGDLGIEDYFYKEGIILIEWADKLGNILPARARTIKIEYLGENKRKICLSSEFQALLEPSQ